MSSFCGYHAHKLSIISGINWVRFSTWSRLFAVNSIIDLYKSLVLQLSIRPPYTTLSTSKFCIYHLSEHILCTQSTLPTISKTSYN